MNIRYFNWNSRYEDWQIHSDVEIQMKIPTVICTLYTSNYLCVEGMNGFQPTTDLKPIIRMSWDLTILLQKILSLHFTIFFKSFVGTLLNIPSIIGIVPSTPTSERAARFQLKLSILTDKLKESPELGSFPKVKIKWAAGTWVAFHGARGRGMTTGPGVCVLVGVGGGAGAQKEPCANSPLSAYRPQSLEAFKSKPN